MSTKNKAPQGQPWKTDELGITTWAKGTDPMDEVRLTLAVMPGASENLRVAASEVHLAMSVARSIALSLFGGEWDEFVVDIYDRLKDMRDDFDHADADVTKDAKEHLHGTNDVRSHD
jgi:hypothetical protein